MSGESQASRPKVLVVDDMTPTLDALVRIVRRGPYDAIPARDGSEAFRLLLEQRGAIKVVVLDLSIQGMSGPDLAVRITERHPAIRFVFVSGTPLEFWPNSEQRKIAQLPQESFVFALKPVTVQMILARIRFLLDRSAHGSGPRLGG